MFFHCIQKEKVCTNIKKTAPIIGLNEIDLVQTTKRFCRRPMFRSTFECGHRMYDLFTFSYCLIIREWMKQQTNELDQAKANQKYADHLFELKAREMDQRACELAQAEADCRRAINMATKDMNNALARERQAKEDAEKQQEQDDNFTEISNHVFGDMLTENPDMAQSAFGPHRVITDRWKGMSPAQLAEIRRIQQAQIEEKEVLYYTY